MVPITAEAFGATSRPSTTMFSARFPLKFCPEEAECTSLEIRIFTTAPGATVRLTTCGLACTGTCFGGWDGEGVWAVVCDFVDGCPGAGDCAGVFVGTADVASVADFGGSTTTKSSSPDGSIRYGSV